MRKFFTGILCCCLLLSAKSQVGTTVVISQIYGGGGNSNAAYQNDFIELFNPTPVAQSLNNWSVQYASASSSSWAVTKLTNFTLQPGQYYLIKLASQAAIGTLLPAEDASGTSNMSATAGKVALSNDTLALTSCLPNAAIVDIVGYGTTASCSEGAPAPAGSNTNSLFRGNNGCTDANNNSTDFAAAAAAPRNTSTVINTCAPPSPTIFPQPAILTIASTVGAPSAVSSYSLSATTLTPAAGNITVTAGTGVEVSLSNGGPFSSAVIVSYSGSALTGVPIYVRITATVAQGVFTGAVTNSGGGAANAMVTINGTIFQNFYNTKANLGLSNLNTWSSTLNGSGSAPAAFSDAYQLFNIVNQTNANYIGTWDVTNAANTTRIVVGDGTNPVTFTVLPGADSVTFATRVDVSNNATLVIQNNRKPFINNIAVGSTIDFAAAGATATDTAKIPVLNYYNLKFSDGIKFLGTGTTTVRGNFIADAVNSMNGATTSVSKLNVFGNVTFVNGASFDAVAGAENARISIGFNGASGTQSLNANGTELKLYRIQRDSTTSACVINVGPNSTLSLGGPSGGGLLLNQNGTNTTTLSTGSNTINFISGGSMSASSTGKLLTANGIVNVLKSQGTGDGGSLRFASGSTLASLVINLDPAITRDTVTIGDSVKVQNFSLTKGKVVVRASAVLSIAANGIITGGSVNSFVDGKMRQEQIVGFASLTFPVGKGNKYAPAILFTNNNLVANGFTVQYFNTGYSSFVVSPATLASYPNYTVSTFEYWNIIRDAPGDPVQVTLYYTDANSFINVPLQVRIANFTANVWNDKGYIFNPSNTSTTNGSVSTLSNVDTFGPFTFAGTELGVVPIKLEYIRGQRTGSSNVLNWKVSCLSTSITMELERAADTRNFASIGNITATQARCGQPFDFTDAQPLSGNNYYRLKMIDVDGKISYSPVVLIISKGKAFEIAGIYPSVVTSSAVLSISSAAATMVETRVTDMAGKTLQSSRQAIPAGSSLINIDGNNLPAGVYNLTVTASGASVSTIRFVKK